MATFSRPLTIPSSDASRDDLRQHFILVQTGLATMRYDDSIHACLSCLKQDENQFGKKGSVSERQRFCSEPCEQLYRRYFDERPSA